MGKNRERTGVLSAPEDGRCREDACEASTQALPDAMRRSRAPAGDVPYVQWGQRIQRGLVSHGT